MNEKELNELSLFVKKIPAYKPKERFHKPKKPPTKAVPERNWRYDAKIQTLKATKSK